METGVYILKTELAPMLNIPINQVERRKEELLEWFKNFFDFELLEGRPVRIKINEVYEEYRQLPRKKYTSEIREADLKRATKDYTRFTIKSLGEEFAPNSKSKIAREAIAEFGYEKYKHTSQIAVVNRFVRKPFNEHAVTNDRQVWVDYLDYTPLSEELLFRWREILSEEKIGEREAANAFYRKARGGDISKEINSFKKALDRFKEETGIIPVLVKEWKIKKE